jgi:hypothetical protein
MSDPVRLSESKHPENGDSSSGIALAESMAKEFRTEPPTDKERGQSSRPEEKLKRGELGAWRPKLTADLLTLLRLTPGDWNAVPVRVGRMVVSLPFLRGGFSDG